MSSLETLPRATHLRDYPVNLSRADGFKIVAYIIYVAVVSVYQSPGVLSLEKFCGNKRVWQKTGTKRKTLPVSREVTQTC
jgi:hypothetical protein